MKPSFERLDKLMHDRGTIPSHVVGFLISYKQALMFHQHMASGWIGKDQNQMLQLALAHLAIFSVRALETFFRDCFVSVCLYKPDFGFAAADKTKGQLTYTDVKALLQDPLKFHDLLAAQKNFQNLATVNDAFSPFFEKSLLDFLDSTDLFVYTATGSVVPTKFRLISLYPNWRADLYALFELRHEIIHNAHHPLPTDQEKIVRQAQIGLLLGQLMGIAIASQIGVGTLSIEAPLKKIMAWECLQRIVQPKMEEQQNALNVQKVLNELENFGDATGHVGPFIFLGQDLMQTEFEGLVAMPPPFDAQRMIVHLVNRPAAERYVVKTLYSLKESSAK